ncbi:MAG: acyl-CoA dehydrogenase family protein [Pseudomonadota bacterium]|nr:acyl-CoA dehydrogenase family protein [Pseudomonadota bacterium]
MDRHFAAALDWPFFATGHVAFAHELDAWSKVSLAAHEGGDVDAACRALVRQLGAGGWLAHAVAGQTYGGAGETIDTRTICLARETLARHDGLADFAFAMQGLGSGAISLAGTAEQKSRYLPRVARGEAIAAFALSEPDAGSDVAALACAARRDGDDYVLDGDKTWISNGGIADFYVVFARDGAPGATRPSDHPPRGSGPAWERPGGRPGTPSTPPVRGSRGISAFIVDADSPGLEIAERIEVIAPHPLARLRFAGCRVAVSKRLGEEGEGFKIAMRTLDVFRTSVAAAALGFARRAFAEALARAVTRPMFGGVLADLQLTQAKLAEMALTIDSAALLTYRAAWLRDRGATVTREAAMAKLAATEGAQRVIDAAVQVCGGLGVQRGQTVERLYREIRALRIYEGASEVQQLIIGRELLKEAR